MKSIFTFSAALLFTGMQLLHGQSQTITIFQPSAGLNNGTDQGGVNSGKDAWVAEGATTNNYGADWYMLALPISNCNNTTCSAYIQFDVSTLPLNVDSVTFGVTHLPHTTYCYSNCNADFYFARIAQPWDEMTLDFNTKPSLDTAFYGPINIAFPNNFGVREYNITSTYLLWKTGAVPNNGFAIYSTTVGCNNAAVYFESFSSDDTVASERPYLKIYTSSTGIHSPVADQINFNLSPNPAQDQAMMKFTLSENSKSIFRLTDVTGRLVMDEVRLEGQGRFEIPLDLSALKQGMYFYTLQTDAGTVSGKLMH